MKTKQIEFWSGDFGKEYTDRNPQNLEEIEHSFYTRLGVKRTQINAEFIGDLSREIRILEVGCNVGSQLIALQSMGFKNLYGIELQSYAVEKSKQLTKGINIIQASAFDIPYKDNYFDLVYTNGVMIHIAPDDLPKIMGEMIRVSGKFIWGFEYYSKELKEIPYRGNNGFMWKADYAQIFLKQSNIIQLVKQKIYPNVLENERDNEDVGFLLEKY